MQAVHDQLTAENKLGSAGRTAGNQAAAYRQGVWETSYLSTDGHFARLLPELRAKLVPTARTYPLNALLRDCLSFYRATGRRVSFAYVLISGVNDEVAHAAELAALLKTHALERGRGVAQYLADPVRGALALRPHRALRR